MRRFRDILKRFCVMTAIFVTMVVVGGCIKDDTEGPSSDGAYTVVLTTRAGGDIEHDAQYPGEDAYNENAINRVMLFFYPDNAGKPDADDTAAIYSEVIEDVNTSHRVSLSIKADLREKLFGHIDGSARVFAVVNLPKSDKNGSASGAPSIKANATVNEIKSTVVETDFRIVGGTLPEFVMLGEGIIKFSDNLKSASGTIPVTRTASKIRIALQITEPMDDYDPTNPDKVLRTWTADPKNIRVYITNGVSKAHIGGAPFPREELSAGDYYKISPSPEDNEESDYNTRARTLEESNIEEYPYWNAVPLYSYPHSWENTPYEDRQTYLVIQVPWKSNTEGIEYTNCYYQVPINLRGGTGSDSDGNPLEIKENTLESNMYYLVKLNIGMLGSFNPEEPLEIQASYYVVPWQDEVLDAKLADNRYLVVDQNNWVINNEDKLDIPFHTSHKTIVARVKMSFYNFNASKDAFDSEDPSGSSSYYAGKPLKRTVTWDINGGTATTDCVNAVFNKTTEQNGKQMFDVTIPDDDSFIIHYEHDMRRWTEMNSSNNPVFPYDNVGDPLPYAGPTSYLKRDDMMNWSKIEIEITIIHEDLLHKIDDTRFMQMVYITQYPAQYIEADYNDNTRRSDGTGAYVFVNGKGGSAETIAKSKNDAANSSVYEWEAVAVFSNSLNQNPNMYVVTVSQLGEEDSDFIIGDPRTLTPNNVLNNGSFKQDPGTDTKEDVEQANGSWGDVAAFDYYVRTPEAHEDPNLPTGYYTWWYFFESYLGQNFYAPQYFATKCGFEKPATAPDMNEDSRILQNYYPTDESTGPGSKEYYIAPKLRIASSYGAVVDRMTRTAARRRCASYQEAGRPAGRWRVPTRAEMQYICNLSAKGKIPRLFSPAPGWRKDADGNIWVYTATTHNTTAYTGTNRFKLRDYAVYWCAQGPARVDGVYGQEITDQRVYGYGLRSDIPSDVGFSADDIADYGKVRIISSFTNEKFGTDDPDPNPRYGTNSRYREGYRAEGTAVRCVYDEWYWVTADGLQDTLPKDKWTTFHWGDKQKASPQE